ncbi:MAG: helix-turn-helix transcriptional regulator [Lachnospiraceae bacterium]|nr:helix-turn-helix transcriptional regulator [Lachnospiraceae bacterium]
MNQEKIGKFIAKCRKENGYTQASLAEKLGITDRAISKWENGKSMPDASIMLELCELLKINVNELLTGEHIIMDNYKEVAEKNLVEMKTQEEKANKKVILAVIVFAVMLLFAWFAGGNIGEDLGRFIYNISH